MTTTVTATDRPSAFWRGDDFPGWLSPMLVKELRQGIQSGVFAWTFIALQAVMFLVVATTLLGPLEGRDVRENPLLFWTPVVLAVAVVIPLRGLQAVSAERVGNNLDLVRLTHLSAARIVTGKWLSLVAQAALLATAALPYLVIRYFFGGVNVVNDLAMFGWTLVAAGVVAAAAVAASTRPVRERIGLMILAYVAANLLPLGVRFFGGSFGRMVPVFIALVVLFTVLLLEFAASAIAPPAENHAARKRWLGLVIVAAWAGAAALDDRQTFFFVMMGTLLPLVAILIDALCERPSTLLSIHAPFAARGPAGRLAALVFTPGWATGLAYVTCVAALGIASVFVGMQRFAPREATNCTCLAIIASAAVVFPLPALVLLARVRRPHLVYLAVQVVCLLVLVVEGVITEEWRTHSPPMAVALFPLAAFFRALNAGNDAIVTLTVAAAVVTLVVYAVVAGPWLRELAATWRRVDSASATRGSVAEAVP
jgi:hypothetical protein